MPMNVGEISAKMTLDKSAFSRGLSAAKGEGKSGGSAIGSSISAGLKTAVLAGAVAAGVAITAGVKSGFDYNSSVQNAKAAFGVLLKDAGKATKTVAELFAYAARTPFQFPEVLTAGRQLAAVGVDISKNIGWIGDIAAVAPEGAGAIAELSRAIARLKSGDFGESFERLRDFGISKMDLIGQGLKFDKAGTFKGSAEQAIEAVRKISESKFKGMTDAMSKTFSGQWSTILDNMNQKLGDATKPLFDWLTNEGLPALNEAFGSIDLTAIFAGFEQFRQPAIEALDAIKKAWDGLQPHMKEFAATIAPAVQELLRDIKNLAPGFRDIITAVLEIGTALLAFYSGDWTTFFTAVDSDLGKIALLVGAVFAVSKISAWSGAVQAAFSGAAGASTAAGTTMLSSGGLGPALLIVGAFAAGVTLGNLIAEIPEVKAALKSLGEQWGELATKYGWFGAGKPTARLTSTDRTKYPTTGRLSGQPTRSRQIRHFGGDVFSTGDYRLIAGERVQSPSQVKDADKQSGGNTYQITVYADSMSDKRAIRREVESALTSQVRLASNNLRLGTV